MRDREKDKYLTISQAAKKFNKKDYQIRYAINTGIIEAFKVGWQWIIRADSIPEDWRV